MFSPICTEQNQTDQKQQQQQKIIFFNANLSGRVKLINFNRRTNERNYFQFRQREKILNWKKNERLK